MRIPPPPYIVLSQDGHMAAYVIDRKLHLVSVDDATVTPVDLPHDAKVMALSPNATQIAVSGNQQLSLLRLTPDVEWSATVNTPGALYRLAIGNHSLIAGTPTVGTSESTLCIWNWSRLVPAFEGKGESLGSVAPYHLRVDETNSRILLWGLAGRGAFSGNGTPFVRLFSTTQNRLQSRWSGEPIPIQYRSFLFPLQGGALGIYNRHKLVITPPDITTDTVTEPLAEYDFDNLEVVAISPQGKYLAWYWNKDGVYQVRIALLDDGEITQEAEVNLQERRPIMAVDDNGRITFALSETPDKISIYTLDNGQLVQRVDLP